MCSEKVLELAEELLSGRISPFAFAVGLRALGLNPDNGAGITLDSLERGVQQNPSVVKELVESLRKTSLLDRLR